MRLLLDFCPLATAAVLGTACLGPVDDLPYHSASAPLIGGAVTAPDEDEAVIALTSSGFPICSGTLIAPSVVLTAAHCIDMGGDNTVHFGNDVNSGGRKIQVVTTRTHPGWTTALGQNDIGVILLQFAQDPELPVRLNTSPASGHVGDPYRVVGFGVHDRESMMADGRKRQGTSTITGLGSGDTLLTGDDNIAVCFGDSGGPGFLSIDGVEYVAGVHSFTSGSECFPPMGDTRVDVHVAEFLQPYIDENDPACTENGRCARIGCSADPDCAPCGPEGTCTMDCALPDPDCPTQAIGELCQADTQCMNGGLCVWWQGDPKTRFCTEPCTSSGDCPAGMSCQSRPQVGNVCYYDEDPAGVLGDGCETATDCGSQICDENVCVYACDLSVDQVCPPDFECKTLNQADYYCYAVPEEDGGGCTVAAAGATAGAAAGAGAGTGPGCRGGVFLGLALLARRRPRRAA
jgi:hypothetical protein